MLQEEIIWTLLYFFNFLFCIEAQLFNTATGIVAVSGKQQKESSKHIHGSSILTLMKNTS